MHKIIGLIFNSLLLVALSLFNSSAMANNSIKVPILTYHGFDPSKPSSMVITTERFEQQMQWLHDNGYTVIPLKQLVSYLQGKIDSLPEKSVVITADDGRKSVYTHMWPIVRKYNIPVTLFIYPTTISNSSYSMTWDQLKELEETGLFDIQGHSYWHPNFKQERKRLADSEYQKLVDAQFISSKRVIDQKLKTDITLFAWPYGIYNKYLENEAEKAGYVAAFTIDARPASKSERMMAQPRYMIVTDQSMKMFAAIASGRAR